MEGLSEEQMPAYGAKADVWSLGVMLHELLTGRQPFMADNAAEMLSEQREALARQTPDGTPTFLAAMPVSAECRDFLRAALQPDPDQRPGAAALLRHPWVAMHAPVASAAQPVAESAPRSSESTLSHCSSSGLSGGSARQSVVLTANDIASVWSSSLYASGTSCSALSMPG